MLTKVIEHYHTQILLSVIIVGGIFFALFFAPFDKPDEDVHYLKAIAVSQGTFFCTEINQQVVDPIDKKVKNFVYQETEKNLPNISPSEKQELNQSIQSKTIKSCSLPFIFYLAPGYVLFVSRHLQLPLITSFYLARLINTFIALALLIVSLKNLPKRYQYLSLFIFSLPMTLYQISSVSKDAYHLGLGIFIINTMLAVWKSKKITPVEFLNVSLSMILFVLTRPQFFWFIFLLVTIPNSFLGQTQHSFSLKMKLLIVSITVCTVGIILGIFIQQHVYLSPHNPATNLPYYQQIDPDLQIKSMITHPFLFSVAVANSFWKFGVYYLKGSVGILGPLSRPLPLIVYIFYILGGLLVTVNLAMSKYLPLLTKHLPILITICCFTQINIFLAMYLYGTPVGDSIIYGVQGRYFILLFPFLFVVSAAIVREILFQGRAPKSMTNSKQ